MEPTTLSPEALAKIEANRQEALAKKQQAEERKKAQIEAQIETNRQEALAKKQQAEERKKAHIRLQEGVVHLKQVVRPQEQIQLYADIAEGAKTYAAKQARNRKSNFKKILTYNWERDAAKVPDSFEFFSALACKEASTVCSTIPPAFKPNYVTAFCYPQKDGRLRGHVDKVLGWVVLFSLGCTCKFWIKGPQMQRKQTIDFESGDVLVFNGGTEYGIQHGIDTIVPQSCPEHLNKDLAHCRVSLQFRQTLRNDIVRKFGYPKKKH